MMETDFHKGSGIVGFVFGAIVIILIDVTIPDRRSLTWAQINYTRCLSDGGTEQHCVGKYLLPEKGAE